MATEQDYAEAMTITLGHEGGWYDGSEARDPNPTMWGVTQKTYDAYRDMRNLPAQSVHNISIEERDHIYRAYWDGTCDLLPRRAAQAMFDMSINAGPVAARKCVQRALNLKDDGVYGPVTLASLRNIKAVEEFTLRCLMERVWYYDDISDNPRLRPNLKSWVGRTVDFYAKYVR